MIIHDLPVKSKENVTEQVLLVQMIMLLHNPGEIDHKLRGKPSIDSGEYRPLIPEQTVHFLIGSGIE